MSLNVKDDVVRPTGVLGSALAIVVSYDLYHDVLWAFLHGLLGWVYILYWALVLNR